LRRNPDLKWRIGPESVAALQEQQEKILQAASRLVKPGGRLIYATCSLLPQENEHVVERFLSGCPEFSRVPAAEVLERQRVRIPSDWRPLNAAGDLMLWPHRAGSDGFFAACMVRAGS
jgi:16S rRNA (cytosine967-C5)-methyltransferase